MAYLAQNYLLGANATPTVFLYHGSELVFSGVELADVTVGADYRLVVDGEGTVERITVENGGTLTVENDGWASDITVLSGGSFSVSYGGMAESVTLTGGTQSAVLTVEGGDVSQITVNSNGILEMRDDGFASDITVNASGRLDMHGGRATDVSMNENAKFYIARGDAARIDVNPGSDLIIQNMNSAISSIREKGGNVQISWESSSETEFYEVTFSSSTFTDLVLGSWDRASVHRSTTAINTTVGDVGWFKLYGGKAINTHVLAGGKMEFVTGGTHQGSLTIESGGTVIVDSVGVVEFTLTGRSTADDYLVNNLSRISGTPTYTIAVTLDQALGVYKLAQGAENFSGSVTIGAQNAFEGVVTVNGAAFEHGDKAYTLRRSGGNLTLDIASLIPPDTEPPVITITASPTTSTTGPVTVTATFTDNVGVVSKRYKIGNGEWHNYTESIAMGANGTVYFLAADAAGNESCEQFTVSNITPSGSIYGDGDLELGDVVSTGKIFANEPIIPGGTYSEVNRVSIHADAQAHFKAVFGGYEITTSGTASITGASSTSIAGAGDISGNFAFGGHYLGSGRASISGDTELNIASGTYSSFVCGGNISGNGAQMALSGDSTLTITGGVFNGNVAGGSDSQGGRITYRNSTITTNISGGTFNARVFGGNVASKQSYARQDASGSTLIDIKGASSEININIDCSHNQVVFNSDIVAGGYTQCKITGSTNVRITGIGENLDFTGVLTGDSSAAGENNNLVLGGRNLAFDDFVGDFNAVQVLGFDSLSVVNNSTVNFTEAINLASVKSWTLELGSTVILGSGVNNFRGDSLNLVFSGDELESEWTILSGSATAVTAWNGSLTGGVTINGETAVWDRAANMYASETYQLYCQVVGSTYNLVVANVGLD